MTNAKQKYLARQYAPIAADRAARLAALRAESKALASECERASVKTLTNDVSGPAVESGCVVALDLVSGAVEQVSVDDVAPTQLVILREGDSAGFCVFSGAGDMYQWATKHAQRFVAACNAYHRVWAGNRFIDGTGTALGLASALLVLGGAA